MQVLKIPTHGHLARQVLMDLYATRFYQSYLVQSTIVLNQTHTKSRLVWRSQNPARKMPDNQMGKGVKKETNSQNSSHKPTTAISKPGQSKRGRPSLKANRKLLNPTLTATNFKELKDIDLCLYLQQIQGKRMKGISLVDQAGNFYFYNKTASEHFEGSLNNLMRTSMFDLMIDESRSRVFQQINAGAFNTLLLKFTIYSKNSKRKYWKSTLNTEATIAEMYYRYLKTVLAKLTPVQFKNQLSPHNFKRVFEDDFWAVEDVSLIPRNLFLVETRISSSMEELTGDPLDDPILAKFITMDTKKIQNESILTEFDKLQEFYPYDT